MATEGWRLEVGMLELDTDEAPASYRVPTALAVARVRTLAGVNFSWSS